MSSSWGSKLEKKLSVLADTASKESIQTLAKWIGFNRKYSPVIASVLATSLTSAPTPTRQWLYWQLVHEVLVLDVDTPNWGRLEDLRIQLGEGSIVPAVTDPKAKSLADKLDGLFKQWDDHNVFGGPTLSTQIRRLLAGDSSEKTSKVAPQQPDAAASAAAPATDKTEVSVPSKQPSPEKDTSKKDNSDSRTSPTSAAIASPKEDEQPKEKNHKEEQQERRHSSLSVASGKEKEVTYDFDSKVRPIPFFESSRLDFQCIAISN
jgi:hypothetical protein